MSTHETSKQPRPTCPHCGHALDDDEMQTQPADLWALAPNEARECIECPRCDKEYWVQGGYVPTYTSAFVEDEFL